MWGNRVTGLGIALLTAACAQSSFDMLLLPGADGRIYRHDPVNNVALGSYSAGVDNLVAHDSNGRSYAGSSGLTTFVTNDFNTGEVVGGMTISSFRSCEVSGSSLFGHSLSTVRKVDVNTGTVVAANALSSAATWHSLSTFGSVVQLLGIHATTGNLALQTATQADATPGAFFTTTIGVLTGSSLGKAAVAVGGTTGSTQLAFTFQDSGAVLLLGRFSLNSAGAFANTNISTTALLGFNSANFLPATLRSHSGWIVVGQDSTNSTLMRIQQFALAGNNPVRISNYTITAPGGGFGTHPSGVYQPSNVVAPEPGTMVALGLGGAALVKRRKRRN